MGLLDAWALAKAVGEEADVAAALAKVVRMRRSHVRLYQPFGRLWPARVIQAQIVAGTFGNALKPLGLA